MQVSEVNLTKETLPDWDTSTIGECFELINGLAFKPNDWKQTGVPIIRIQNLNDPDATLNYFQGSVPERNKIDSGDLLFAWSGTLGSSFGARIWDGPSGVLNQHIFKVLTDENVITKDFALLAFALVEQDIAREAHGFKSSFVHVKKSDLQKVVLQIPPVAEQRKIFSALSDVDALIAGLEKLIAKKRDLKQAVMQQLLTGQIRLPGFSGEWTVKRLGDLAEMGSGGTPPSANTAYYGGDIPWVAIADMTGGGKYIAATERNLTALGLANSAAQMFPAGTVLYAMYASLGECSISTVPVTTSQAILGIRPKANLNPEFLYYLLTSWKPMVKGLGQQGTQANLNKGIVADFKISLPAFDEQESIAAVLVEIDNELAVLEARLAKTRELKQGMMQELLTGKTRLI
ncbi:MAG: restriction endonuclease subunit S [Rhodoferax sp.]